MMALNPESHANYCPDSVSSATLHPCGTILATCSGQRHEPEPRDTLNELRSESTETSEDEPLYLPQNIDNSLKIWTL